MRTTFTTRRSLARQARRAQLSRVIAFAEEWDFKYQGPREEDKILEFLEKLGQDTVIELANDYAVNTFPPTETKDRVHTSFLFFGQVGEGTEPP